MASDPTPAYAPKRPRPHICVCGRPDHQALIRQLGEALGHDLPALPETPEQVWNRLLDEVEEMRRAR